MFQTHAKDGRLLTPKWRASIKAHGEEIRQRAIKKSAEVRRARAVKISLAPVKSERPDL